MAYIHVETNARVCFTTCRNGGTQTYWLDYGEDANAAYQAVELPTKENRPLRRRLLNANERRMTRKGYRAAQIDKRPSAYNEAEVMLSQARRVALCVVGLVNKIVERGFENGEVALCSLLEVEPSEDIRVLRWIWNANIKSCDEFRAKRAAWQEEREAQALVRANLKTLRDQARAEVFANI
jgi:hypothetical protein